MELLFLQPFMFQQQVESNNS